jgi:hypothetical protein
MKFSVILYKNRKYITIAAILIGIASILGFLPKTFFGLSENNTKYLFTGLVVACLVVYWKFSFNNPNKSVSIGAFRKQSTYRNTQQQAPPPSNPMPHSREPIESRASNNSYTAEGAEFQEQLPPPRPPRSAPAQPPTPTSDVQTSALKPRPSNRNTRTFEGF